MSLQSIVNTLCLTRIEQQCMQGYPYIAVQSVSGTLCLQRFAATQRIALQALAKHCITVYLCFLIEFCSWVRIIYNCEHSRTMKRDGNAAQDLSEYYQPH